MARLKDAVEEDSAAEAEEGSQEIADLDKRAKFLKSARRKIDGARRSIEKISADRKAENKTINDTFRDLKTNLGMKRDDAEYCLRLLNLDQEERDKALDTMREFFVVFGIGEQATFLTAGDRSRKSSAEGSQRVQ